MDIQINTNQRMISVEGRIDSLSSPQLDETLQAFNPSEGSLILHLANCNYLSSAGIRILLKHQKRWASVHHNLILTQTARELMQVFETSGLQKVFCFESTLENAQRKLLNPNIKRLQTSEIHLNGKTMIFKTLPFTEKGVHWIEPDIVTYQELGNAWGWGSPVNLNNLQTADSFFVKIGHCLAFLALNDASDSDFRLVNDQLHNGIPLMEAYSFADQPMAQLIVKDHEPTSLDELQHTLKLLQKMHNLQSKHLLVVAVSRDEEDPFVAFFTNFQALGEANASTNSTLNNKNYPGIQLKLDDLQLIENQYDLDDFLTSHLSYDNISAVKPLQADSSFVAPLLWFFGTDHFETANNKRLIIEADETFLADHVSCFLTRALFSDAARLRIETLHGGFSAQTYHVTSFDAEGRKMRPTVMKAAHRDLIERESERCTQYALPYIFNNSAVVLGTSFYGEKGALRYNFVGIGGESASLKWLTHYYQAWNAEQLEPVFDKVFLQILKPWYGQPVPKTIRPFAEHDPTATFFPHIYQTVKELFQISAEEKYIFVDETKRMMLNPYWFLKHEYHLKREKTIRYFTGICHGDLNMQNILLDENMNVYLIDFSETRPRAIVSDFARLEAIFLVDNAPVSNDLAMESYIRFLENFYATDHLGIRPENVYEGPSPALVEKNHALSCKMRKYAFESTHQNPDTFPYYMALLEWVLPIVCYTVPIPQRRVSLILSAMLCEKLMNDHFANA